ncbi:transcriptional regulator, AsnC family [Andreprevotia lacus DSM 23236]|jgi:Lrp/AsnC family leucine-responsive transcriptional regulator|uniref:Transcriptional regulator, AsnC family n=1 Tax=Andreprevotia lacus DSM 23236 TaxID=1121001 RepID=A0A1W1XK44_9NEIS|nr:Lrp/AsnC family transcriptional regulator [Andreprevotia lacus]SMC24356.1 transcriptional regulator, AsnC family [Andreprevotia lacus DSM 23236]
MKPKYEADRLDRRILMLLQQNARLSNTEIGKRVGLSQPAVTARIQKMEQAGVITGYAARIDPGPLGMEISAYIRLRTTHEHIKRCLTLFDAIPAITQADRITGEDCFIVRVTVPTMNELEAVIDQLATLGAVTTSIVLASYPGKPLPLGS